MANSFSEDSEICIKEKCTKAATQTILKHVLFLTFKNAVKITQNCGLANVTS